MRCCEGRGERPAPYPDCPCRCRSHCHRSDTRPGAGAGAGTGGRLETADAAGGLYSHEPENPQTWLSLEGTRSGVELGVVHCFYATG